MMFPPPQFPGLPGTTGTFGFTLTASCLDGGQARGEGTATVTYASATQPGHLQGEMTLVHQACRERLRLTDNPIELNGDPGVVVHSTATAQGGVVTAWRVTQTGAFAWDRGEGHSGRCTVDLVSELVTSSQQMRTTGTFCGLQINQSDPFVL